MIWERVKLKFSLMDCRCVHSLIQQRTEHLYLSRLMLGAGYRGGKGHCPLKPRETDKQKTSDLNAECWSQVHLCVYRMGHAVMGEHGRKRAALKREKLGILLASVDLLYSFIHTHNWSQVASACSSLKQDFGSWPETEVGPQKWECWILAPRPPGTVTSNMALACQQRRNEFPHWDRR